MKETKNTENKNVMKSFKKARTINTIVDSQSKQITVIAESKDSYKTVGNKVIKKSDVEKNIAKNTIDYRYNSSDDKKYTQIQKKLCDILNLDENSDIRSFEKIFTVKRTTRYFNILKSDSVVLNRASAIELLLTDSDNEKIKDSFESVLVSKTESKLEKYTKHIKNSNVYSLVLKTKDDIVKCANLLKA